MIKIYFYQNKSSFHSQLINLKKSLKALNGSQLTKSNMFPLMNHFILLIPKPLHIMMKDSKRMGLIESVKFVKCTSKVKASSILDGSKLALAG